ncbi:MAG TPA: hypothetical protein VE973_04205 [Candidatus Limnocylindria bacterium]|nr:hypothetical protein [Candidatus Limnocylindria bacterium]
MNEDQAKNADWHPEGSNEAGENPELKMKALEAQLAELQTAFKGLESKLEDSSNIDFENADMEPAKEKTKGLVKVLEAAGMSMEGIENVQDFIRISRILLESAALVAAGVYVGNKLSGPGDIHAGNTKEFLEIAVPYAAAVTAMAVNAGRRIFEFGEHGSGKKLSISEFLKKARTGEI